MHRVRRYQRAEGAAFVRQGQRGHLGLCPLPAHADSWSSLTFQRFAPESRWISVVVPASLISIFAGPPRTQAGRPEGANQTEGV